MTAFGRWFTKWFWTYRYWTWPPLLVLAVTISWLAYTVATSGDAIRFISFFFLSAIGITVYRWVRGELPPLWLTITVLTIPLFMWGFWLLKPEWYTEWRASGYFLWTVIVMAVFGWLSNHRSVSIANLARIGLLLLMITTICIGAYGKWEKKQEAAQARAQAARQELIDRGEFPCPFNFTLRMTKEWSKTVARPAGCHFTVGRRAPVGYEMAAETKTGSLLARSMPGQTIRQHLPDVISFRLRIIEEEDENEVDVLVSLYRR